MQDVSDAVASPPWAERYCRVRTLTEAIAEPLSAEDQTAQSMPDVSPTKWHRAHVTWFFEEFVLGPNVVGYEPFHPGFRFLFNSYYEAVGPRHARPERGVITRPSIEEVAAYRRHVDAAMVDLLGSGTASPEVLALVELGLHHEQQHQELALMDIKHVLSRNVLDPVYRPSSAGEAPSGQGPVAGTSTEHRSAPVGPGTEPIADGQPTSAGRDRSTSDGPGWLEHAGGVVEVGHGGEGFAFDNEGPRHRQLLEPFAVADRPVTCGEVLAFIADDGYRRPELWLSDGWATVQAEGWDAPLYWRHEGGDEWSLFTLAGRRPVDPDEPVCHVSYYEADAIARWADARLPSEAEWESTLGAGPVGDRFDLDRLHPGTGGGPGDVWEWTASAYLPYPGFRPAAGAVGEYNGKFMVNQHVLRGGSALTPPGHARPTYRNFFPPSARWPMTGLRLARHLEDR